MSRRQILAEVLAHLEAERFRPPPRKPRTAHCEPPEPITDQQAAANRKALEEAIGSDAVVIEWRDNQHTTRGAA